MLLYFSFWYFSSSQSHTHTHIYLQISSHRLWTIFLFCLILALSLEEIIVILNIFAKKKNKLMWIYQRKERKKNLIILKQKKENNNDVSWIRKKRVKEKVIIWISNAWEMPNLREN